MPSHAVAQMMREGGANEDRAPLMGDCTAKPRHSIGPLNATNAAAFGRRSLGSGSVVAEEESDQIKELSHLQSSGFQRSSFDTTQFTPQRSFSHRLSESLSLSDSVQLHEWPENGDGAGPAVLGRSSMSKMLFNLNRGMSGLFSGGDGASGSLSPAASAAVVKGEHHRMTAARVADSHECVTIFFSDLVGFSSWACNLPPVTVMSTLNDLYSRLDDIIAKELPTLYKVSVHTVCMHAWLSE